MPGNNKVLFESLMPPTKNPCTSLVKFSFAAMVALVLLSKGGTPAL